MSWWHQLFSGHKDAQSLSKQEIGRHGEEVAAQFLRRQGIRILYRNWRAGSWELDMVGEDTQGIIFVEVKTRKTQGMTTPVEAIQYKKKLSLIKAAKAWLAAHEHHGAYEKPCRFAVVAVFYDTQTTQDSYKVEFYDHAFDLS